VQQSTPLAQGYGLVLASEATATVTTSALALALAFAFALAFSLALALVFVAFLVAAIGVRSVRIVVRHVVVRGRRVVVRGRRRSRRVVRHVVVRRDVRVVVAGVVVVGVAVNSSSINAVIEAAVLGNCNIYRLVVSGCVHRAEAVNTSRETVGQVGGKDAILILVVQTLEEGKLRRIRDGGAVDGVDELNGNMAVRRHDAVLNLLGSTEVVLLRIDEVAQVHVFNVHLESKRLIGSESAAINGEEYLGSRHGGRRDDLSHGHAITTASRNLLAIRQRLAKAEVDEVVGRGKRGLLTSDWRILAILLATSANNRGVEGE